MIRIPAKLARMRPTTSFIPASTASTGALPFLLKSLMPSSQTRAAMPDSERAAPRDPSRPVYLDEAARETPAVALAGAAREVLRMADVVEAMLRGALDALVRGRPQA